MLKILLIFSENPDRILIGIAWNGQINLGRIDMLKILRLSIHEYDILLGDFFLGSSLSFPALFYGFQHSGLVQILMY